MRLVLLLVVCGFAAVAMTTPLASAHLGHDEQTPTEPLVPSEVPVWFRPGVGSLGILLTIWSARAAAQGRLPRWAGAGGSLTGVGLLIVALTTQSSWF